MYNRISHLSLILSALILVLFSGCGRVRIDESLSPEEQWEIARAYFEHENYLDAIDVLTSFTLNYSGSTLIDSAQYLLAESHFASKEYILASAEYNRLVQNFPQSPLVDDARFKIILSNVCLSPRYSLDQKYTEKTINAIQDFLDDYPSTDLEVRMTTRPTSWQTMRKIFTLGFWPTPRSTVSQVPIFRTKVVYPHRSRSFGQWLLQIMTIGLYSPPEPALRTPRSQEVDGDWVVQKALSDTRSRLAKKDFKAGELYYRMKKYPSAVIYFDSVLDSYEETSWARKALRLKGDALFAMRKYQEAATSYERYLREYKDHEGGVTSRLNECRQRLQETTLSLP